MGLFQNKPQAKQQSTQDQAAAIEQRFMDENFREELRNHGRLYFEKIIEENGVLFRKDLDATVAKVDTELKEHITTQLDYAIANMNAELKEHVTKQLDVQLTEYTRSIKEAQDIAIESLNHSVKTVQEQHQQLGESLERDVTMLSRKVADQEAILTNAFKENADRVLAMKDAQAQTLAWLNKSVQALQEQHEQLAALLQTNLATQEAMLVNTFQENMAQVIEHYLLGALGEQYDMKAQLPAILQQLEANKQEIVDDIKL